MRSPEDVSLLERPSWWTVNHTLALLAVALLITLLVLGWVMALKKQVEGRQCFCAKVNSVFATWLCTIP
jgi:predicted negative regulator of RcsB-dependent stress response